LARDSCVLKFKDQEMAEVIGQRENNMIAGNKEDRKWRWVFLFLLLFLSQTLIFSHFEMGFFFFSVIKKWKGMMV
jgi:hypothetical protein